MRFTDHRDANGAVLICLGANRQDWSIAAGHGLESIAEAGIVAGKIRITKALHDVRALADRTLGNVRTHARTYRVVLDQDIGRPGALYIFLIPDQAHDAQHCNDGDHDHYFQQGEPARTPLSTHSLTPVSVDFVPSFCSVTRTPIIEATSV